MQVIARCFALWLFGVCALAQAQTLRCELLADATISGSQVMPGDVMQLSGDVGAQGGPESQAWLKMPLAAAPRVGQMAQLTRQEIEHWLRRVRPERGLRIEWQGAQAVKLRRAQQSVAWAGLVEPAQAALQQELARRGQQASLHAIVPETQLALPIGRIETSVRPLRLDTLGARVPVWMDIKVDGVFYRAVEVMFALEGELAAPQDRVQRGASVVLQVVQGGVVLETRAVVQQDAMVGSRVQVKPEHAAQAVMARVVSNKLVLAD